MPLTLYIALVLLAILVALQLVALVRGGRRAARRRHTIPLNSNGVHLKPGGSANLKLSTRGAREAIELERVFVSNAGTQGGAGDWLVQDIVIDGRSQYAQVGPLPGDMFASSAIHSYLTFEACPRYAKIDVVISYIGTNPDGAPFYGALHGEALSDREMAKRRKAQARRERAELAAYTRLKRERAEAEQVAKARLEAEAQLS